MSQSHRLSISEMMILAVCLLLIVGGPQLAHEVFLQANVIKTLNALQNYQAQYHLYQADYQALPGDDSAVEQHFAHMNLAAGNGDGKIDGRFDSSDPKDESFLLWAHLRAAGLIPPQVDQGQPRNPYGGVYGFQAGADGSTELCTNRLPKSVAQSLESHLGNHASDISEDAETLCLPL